jgi:alpha-ketoglutarate-dependent taurine dioxygenase
MIPHSQSVAAGAVSVKIALPASATPPSIPVIESAATTLEELAEWSQLHRSQLDDQLDGNGAVLIRNTPFNDTASFAGAARIVGGEMMSLPEDTSPRTQLKENVFTSTDHPPEHSILLHNEFSYSYKFPQRLMFGCIQPAAVGGETPLADCRRVLQRIDKAIRQRFAKRNWMYVRNFGLGFGVTWQHFFKTAQRPQVESHCRASFTDFQWKGPDALRTHQIRPAEITHPRNRTSSWFNHIVFWHISSVEPALRELLLEECAAEDLPNNTYYGDGGTIEDSVLDELRGAYEAETLQISWRRGDLLMLDNLSIAHGRNAFVPPRQILFASAQPMLREL